MATVTIEMTDKDYADLLRELGSRLRFSHDTSNEWEQIGRAILTSTYNAKVVVA